jgi:hypothetical protein
MDGRVGREVIREHIAYKKSITIAGFRALLPAI